MAKILAVVELEDQDGIVILESLRQQQRELDSGVCVDLDSPTRCIGVVRIVGVARDVGQATGATRKLAHVVPLDEL